MTQELIDAHRFTKIPPGRNLIDGEHISSATGRTLDAISPINGEVLTQLAASDAEDVARAVASARAAFEDGRWSKRTPAERKQILTKWADLIEANALELAVLGARDNGTEIRMAFNAEPRNAAATIRYYGETIDKTYGEIAPTQADVLGLVHREPVGVVAAIVPWNFPMMIGAWKLGPALAAGNSVVLKPPESASLSLLKMCALALEAGLPPGVLNVVTGDGSKAGAALALSDDVDVLAFTGSAAVGRTLLKSAAESNLKRVYLELGGKSANIIFPDAPMEAALRGTIGAIFANSGQVCVAASRLLVHASIIEEVTAQVTDLAKALQVGDPLSLDISVGAVHSPVQLQKNLGVVEQALAQGAKIVTGGKALHADSGGTYMEPTVLTGATAESAVFQEEVFGPVLTVHGFEDEADAIRLANNSKYGLAGVLWTQELSRAHRMVGALKTGMVQVNRAMPVDVTSPLGGVKQSGNGYDKSLHALDKFTNLKTAWLQL
ncbi:aldehyde dehydrogenase family protein [Yoonia sp. R2331]|uniref:aldehyde dehydrogenase family protein n=1 Tax=Yoonia sp. R2331 TaxID=3237238 RepID=UPI0034E5889D